MIHRYLLIYAPTCFLGYSETQIFTYFFSMCLYIQQLHAIEAKDKMQWY